MGNIPSADLGRIDAEEDQTFLRLQSSVLFNDAFVSSLTEKLPLFGFPDFEGEQIKPEKSKEPASDELLLQKLVDVLSHDPESRHSKVEDHDQLSVEEVVGTSGFHALSTKRSRLLIRMMHSYSAFLKGYAAKVSSGKHDNYWNLPDAPQDELSADSSQDRLLALSIGMTLTLIQSLGTTSSALLVAMLSNLVENLATFRALSLCTPDGNLHSAIQSLMAFAEGLAEHNDGSVQALALSVRLALGLLTGAVSSIAQVAHELSVLPSQDCPRLHPKVFELVAACVAMEPCYSLSFPSNKFVTDKVGLPHQAVGSQASAVKEDPSLFSFATDGTFVYTFNGATHVLQKVGSGYKDSVPGDLVCANPAAARQAWDREVEMTSSSAPLPATVRSKIVVHGGKLYLRLDALRHSHIALFDAETLSFDRIVDVSAGVDEFVASNSSAMLPEPGHRRFTVDLAKSKALFLQAVNHHQIKVVSATIDELHDVTAAVAACIDEKGSTLRLEDVCLITDSIQTSVQPLTLVVNVECCVAAQGFGELCLPLASDSKSLLGLYSHPVFEACAQRVFDLSSDIEIVSAYFAEENNKGQNIADIITPYWMQFLAKSPDKSENQDFAAIVARVQSVTNGAITVEGSQLFVNYRIGGNVEHVAKFDAQCQWTWLVKAAREHFCKLSHRFFAVFFDSKLSVSRHVAVDATGVSSPDLRYCDILYNSVQFIVLSSSISTSEDLKVHVKGLRYKVNGTLERELGHIHAKSLGVPGVFSYDIFNNVLYAYDSHANALIKWQNGGYAPVILDVEHESGGSLLAKDPAERLHHFMAQPTREANLPNVLFTLLERLSEPYGCSYRCMNSDNNIYNYVKLTARVGADSNDKHRCSIVANNVPVAFDDEVAGQCLGYHVAVFTPQGKLFQHYLFANEEEESASDRMMMFLNSVPRGYVVCITNANCIHDNMSTAIYESLTSIGLVDLEVLEGENGPVGFVCIGRKGLPSGKAELVTAKPNQTASILRIFPPLNVPLALESTPACIARLMDLCIATIGQLNTSYNAHQVPRLCSLLRILHAHVYHYTKHSDPGLLRECVGPCVPKFKTALLDLTRSALMSHAYVEEGVLSLFVCALGLLYKSQEEQVALISAYAEAFEANTLTASEEKLLEILLQRFGDPLNVLSVKQKAVVYSNAKNIFNATVRLINAHIARAALFVESRIVSASVSVLFALTKLLLACDAEPIVTSTPHARCETLFDIVLRLSALALNVLQSASNSASADDTDDKSALQILNNLRQSPVGSVLPMVIMSLSGVVTKGGYALLSKSLESIVAIIDSLSQCMHAIDQILARMPAESREYDNTIVKKSLVSRVFESPHPYRSNMDEVTIVSFPGALYVTLTFDTNSRTEHDCDYVLFRDMDDNPLHEGRFTGRDGNQTFAGVGAVPPLVVTKDQFKIYFHSDGSVEDWGYKITAQAVYPPKANSHNRHNWLLKLNFEIVHTLCSIGTALIRGPEKNFELEAKYAHYMENSLIKPELFAYREDNLSTEDLFLQDLVERRPGGLGEKFVRQIKSKVLEDRGNMEAINSAVYASCAAILKANNLAKEALAFAAGTRDDASATLCKAWRAGQKMRSYFEFKDARGAIGEGDVVSASKSLYAGADSDVIDQESHRIISRACFLLRTPADAPLPENSNTKATTPTKKWPFDRGYPSPAQGERGTERWRLAAKAVALQRQISDDTRNVATMWHSLVGEAVVVDKLKNVLMHRRKFAERTRTGKHLTPTEKVLQFIQSDVSVDKLEEVNNVRNKRAILRAKGMDVFAKLADQLRFPFSIFVASTSFVAAMQAIKKEDGTVHYANDLEGCSPDQQTFVHQKFYELLRRNVALILSSMGQLALDPRDQVWKDAVATALSACSLDYEVSDHAIVLDSGLPDALEVVLKSNMHKDLTARARSLLEIAVSKFVVLETRSEVAVEPTELNKRLVQLLSSLLVVAAGSVSVDPMNCAIRTSGESWAIHGALRSENFGTSYALPAYDLHADHSFSFWLHRPLSKALDKPVGPEEWVGALVMRGPAWKEEYKQVDGELGGLGTIVAFNIESKSARVKWQSGKELDYQYSPESRSSCEVVVVDPRVGGILLSRGDCNLCDCSEGRSMPYFSAFSMMLLPDSSLLLVYQPADKEPVLIRSVACVPADIWTHVAVSCDIRFMCRLFVNGALDTEASIASLDLNESIVSTESAHPIGGQGVVSELLQVPDASKIALWFDDRSCISAEHGCLCLSADVDGQNQVLWSSDRDLPQAGAGATVVRGNSVLCQYDPAEGSQGNEEWGYKCNAIGLPEKALRQLANVVSKVPLYIGHPPPFMLAHVKHLSHGFEGQLSHVSGFNHSLSPAQIAALYSDQQSAVGSDSDFVDEVGIISIFGILRKAVSSLDHLSDTSLRRTFANSGMLDVLMDLFRCGSSTAQTAAYHTATAVLPPMDVELVDGLALRHGLLGPNCRTFLQFLASSIGEGLNQMARRSDRPSAQVPNMLVDSSLNRAAVVAAQIKLFREFACGHDAWSADVTGMVRELMDKASITLRTMVELRVQEFALPLQDSVCWDKMPSAHRLRESDDVLALLAFFGYDVAGFYPGASVLYHQKDSGVCEEAVVIGATKPPVVTKELKAKNKELADAWDRVVGNYGEAVCIALRSCPHQCMVVPRCFVVPHGVTPLPPKFENYLYVHIGFDNIVALFDQIAAVDLTDRRPKPAAFVRFEEKRAQYESEHPYPDNADVYETIDFPGAEEIVITFDESSLTETNCDFVEFFRTSERKEIWGARYSGHNGDQNFPGFGGRVALVIPSGCTTMHFHSDGSTNDWGYKFTASAKVKTVIEPPNMPALPAQSMLANIKLLAMKTAYRLVETSELATRHLSPAFGAMFKCAVAPKPTNKIHSVLGSSGKELVLESNHPYEDSLDVTLPVHVPGAKSFTITFDPETRTENNCDHLSFYMDEGRTQRAPDSEQYTGGKDGSASNWPGLNNRPPLIIEGDTFYIFFHSDGSVNDWGWKAYIIVNVAGKGTKGPLVTRGDGQDAAAADMSFTTLQSLAADGISRTAPSAYKGLSKFSFSQAVAVNSFHVSSPCECLEVPESKSEDIVHESKSQEAAHDIEIRRVNDASKRMVVVVAPEVAIHTSPSAEADQVTAVQCGHRLHVLEELAIDGDWLRVTAVGKNPAGEGLGWVRARNDDEEFVQTVYVRREVVPIALLPTAPQRVAKDTKAKKLPNPMYGVVDGPGAGEANSSFSASPSAATLLQQDLQFVDAAICDYALVAGIEYANSCVSSMVKRWPAGAPFSTDQFDSVSLLLTYLNMFVTKSSKGEVAERGVPSNEDTITNIMELLLSPRQDPSIALELLDFAVATLKNSGPTNKFLVSVGESEDFESTHPYDHNMDADWRFHFPDAKRLEIAFDPQCCTENNYDFITILDAQKESALYEPKIHGLLSAADRHWPGVNAPKVVLPVDSCVINFKSDGGTNDWGFKGTVTAIFDEPDAATVAQEKEKSGALTADHTVLACWIFFFMSMYKALPSVLGRALFSVSNFRTITRFFHRAPAEVKPMLIDVFVVFSREIVASCKDIEEVHSDMLELEQQLLTFADELHQANGDASSISPTLQSVVQLLMSIDSVLFVIRHQTQGSRPAPELDLECAVHHEGMRTLVGHSLDKDKGSVRWDVKLTSFTVPPVIGLTAGPFKLFQRPVGQNEDRFELGWSMDSLTVSGGANSRTAPFGQNCKPWAPGDTVSVVFDRTAASVSFLLNDALVGTAVGPPAALPVFEMDISGVELFLAFTLMSADDTVIAQLAKPTVSSAAIARKTPTSGMDWLLPIYEANSILASVSQQRIPPLILGSKLLPYCSKKHCITIGLEDAELSDGQEIVREVTLPGAQSLHLSIQRLALRPSDQFEVLDYEDNVLLHLTPDAELSFNANVDALVFSVVQKSFDDRPQRLALGVQTPGKVINVGDRVRRGPDWKFGVQDGGVGSTGVVTKVRNWKSSSSAGALVRWANGREALYRFGHEGKFDLQIVPQDPNGLAANGTWSSARDTIKIRIRLGITGCNDVRVRHVACTVFPSYPAGVCMSHPDFEPMRRRMCSLYISSNRDSLAALTKHMNKVARTKGLNRDDLLTAKYADVAPSKDDLTRSVALKELFDSVAFEVDEGEIAAMEIAATEAEAEASVLETTDECGLEVERWSGPHQNSALEGMAYWAGINDFATEDEARMAASQVEGCCGFTVERGVFSLRTGSLLVARDGAVSFVLSRCAPVPAVRDDEVVLMVDNESSGGEREDEEQYVEALFALAGDSHTDGGEDGPFEYEDNHACNNGGEDDDDDDDEDNDDNEDDTVDDECSHSSGESASSSESTLVDVPEESAQVPPTRIQCAKCRCACRQHPSGTWSNGWTCDWPAHVGENGFSSTEPVYGCESVIRCNWGVCGTCWAKVEGAATQRIGSLTKKLLSGESTPIACQYLIVQLLNAALVKALPFVDLAKASSIPSTLAAMVSRNRDLILELVKQAPFVDALAATASPGGMFDLPLSRFKAKKHINSGKVDSEGRWSVFAQAFRVMHYMPARALRRADRLYSTKFLGEHAQDAGGPYRESFDNYCQELQSAALPLLLRTPNGRHAVGYNREKFILHPSATSATQLAMLTFLGKLMGVAIRSKEFLALNIAPFVWKLIVGETPTIEDLEGIDFSAVKSLKQLRDIDSSGVDADTFGSIFFETFTTITSDDRTAELVPDGAHLDVTFENRKEYVDAVLRFRLHEFDRQAAAIREGIAAVVPLRLLSMFTAAEVEEMVCGQAEIDVALLQSIAEYSGCAAADPHIRNFWQIMHAFDNVERSAFIRFTWGRSRLPLTAEGFAQRFKIQSFNKAPPDQYFPLAHTCFFSVELPRYSSLEIMREKLLYAIFNCEAIDGDDTATGIAVAAMGWEEEEE